MTDPPPVPPSDSNFVHPALLDVIRDEFGRVAYTQKTHQKMVDRLNRRLLWEKRLNAALIAATAGNTVGVVVTNSRAAELWSLGFAAAALLLTVYGLSRNREWLVEQHRHAAHTLWPLRERYVHLVGDLLAGALTESQGRAERAALTAAVAHVYASAPHTDDESYAAAQRALKHREELTFSAQEVDVMLPTALRSAPLLTSNHPPVAAWRRRLANWLLRQ
jgi:hypothetical protein